MPQVLKYTFSLYKTNMFLYRFPEKLIHQSAKHCLNQRAYNAKFLIPSFYIVLLGFRQRNKLLLTWILGEQY